MHSTLITKIKPSELKSNDLPTCVNNIYLERTVWHTEMKLLDITVFEG